MMKIAFCALLALTIWHPAQAQSYVNAAAVESTCKLELSKASKGPGSCIMLFRGFIDGFASGADRGLRVAFMQDQKNLATTEGIDDVQFRIGQLRSSASCLPTQATAKQVAEVFLQFMKAHPNRRSEPYREPMLDALQSYYCPR
jgi:hypothetical protein